MLTGPDLRIATYSDRNFCIFIFCTVFIMFKVKSELGKAPVVRFHA